MACPTMRPPSPFQTVNRFLLVLSKIRGIFSNNKTGHLTSTRGAISRGWYKMDIAAGTSSVATSHKMLTAPLSYGTNNL